MSTGKTFHKGGDARRFHRERASKGVVAAVCISKESADELAKWRGGKVFEHVTFTKELCSDGCCVCYGHHFWIVKYDEPTDITHRIARLVGGRKVKLIREGDAMMKL